MSAVQAGSCEPIDNVCQRTDTVHEDPERWEGLRWLEDTPGVRDSRYSQRTCLPVEDHSHREQECCCGTSGLSIWESRDDHMREATGEDKDLNAVE